MDKIIFRIFVQLPHPWRTEEYNNYSEQLLFDDVYH
jgi:hypothetical protein